MKIGYIHLDSGETGVYDDRQWIDRYRFVQGTDIGVVYRMRISHRNPGLEGFVADGPSGKPYLLKERDMLTEHRSGDVVIVEVISPGYDGKMPRVSERLNLSADDPGWAEFERLKRFDPCPKRLTRLSDPLLRFMGYYRGIEWIADALPPELEAVKEQFNLRVEPGFNPDLDERFAAQRRYWLAEAIESAEAQIAVARTAACTVIDVNEGGLALNLPHERKVERINDASIPLIARAIKLQGLQGIVLVDAVRMSKPQGKRYLERLKAELLSRYVRCDVLGFSRSGMVELLVRRG